MTDEEYKKVTQDEFLELANKIGEYIYGLTKNSEYTLELLHHLALIEIIVLAQQKKTTPEYVMRKYVQAIIYGLDDYCKDKSEQEQENITINPNSKYDKKLN